MQCSYHSFRLSIRHVSPTYFSTFDTRVLQRRRSQNIQYAGWFGVYSCRAHAPNQDETNNTTREEKHQIHNNSREYILYECVAAYCLFGCFDRAYWKLNQHHIQCEWRIKYDCGKHSQRGRREHIVADTVLCSMLTIRLPSQLSSNPRLVQTCIRSASGENKNLNCFDARMK